MILDSSAVVAIVFEEQGYEALLLRMKAATNVAIGAPTLTELSIVLARRLKHNARPQVHALLIAVEAQVIPFTEDHHVEALRAFERFGKGRHPAALNFGDCLSYAIARIAGEPLLFVGDDFLKTDIHAA